MRTKYKQWAVDYLEIHPELVINELKEDDPFLSGHPLEMEIGSGKGDFIFSLASRNPNVHYLAIEKIKTVAGMMAKKLSDNDIQNVKVIPLDVEVILSIIPKGSVDKIYLNFSDPWPKKRHTKRRLTYITFLNRYYEILKSEARLIIKTDNDSLYEFTLEEIQNSKFKLIHHEFDYKFDEVNDAMSEYERKFREKRNPIHRIILEK